MKIDRDKLPVARDNDANLDRLLAFHGSVKALRRLWVSVHEGRGDSAFADTIRDYLDCEAAKLLDVDKELLQEISHAFSQTTDLRLRCPRGVERRLNVKLEGV